MGDPHMLTKINKNMQNYCLKVTVISGLRELNQKDHGLGQIQETMSPPKRDSELAHQVKMLADKEADRNSYEKENLLTQVFSDLQTHKTF